MSSRQVGEGGKPKDDLVNRPYLIEKMTRGGGGGQKWPILRRHSLWTAPKRKTLAFKFHAQKRILRLKTCQNTFAQWYNGWVSKLLDRFLGYCVLQRPCEFKNVSKTSVIKFNVILP